MNTTTADTTTRRFFDRWMQLRPVEASFLGLHEHDGRLPDGGRDEALAEIALLESYASDLSRGPDGLDAELGRYFADLSLFNLRELRLWERMADAPDQVGSAIFMLFTRDLAPLETRIEAIARCLEDAPRFLRASRHRLQRPVRLWNEVALETARQLPALVELVLTATPANGLRRRVAQAGAATREAVADYARWLEDDVLPGAEAEYRIGEEAFERLLQLRRLPAGPDAILELGRRYLAEVEEQRQELVARAWPGKTTEEVQEAIRSDHAESFDGALSEYRESIARAREFVVSKSLATVPADEVLQVVETPSFLRPVLPFAAYEPAPYFDERQIGIYLVTPPADPARLAESNRPGILNTSVHEGYPGHHLQFVCANQNRSLLRLLAGFHATEYVEGWAHYCEQLMYEEGFNTGPEIRFIQLEDLVWRACRIVIDVQLCRGRMTFEDAVDMLVQRAGMSRENATAEVKRYTYTPGYQLSYLYGKHLLLELRQRVRTREGAGFSLREFHDGLLYAGAVPSVFWDELF